MRKTDSLEKTLMLGKIEGRRRREWQRMKWLNGITTRYTWALGVGDGQGSMACCSPWGCKELDTTELLNWTELEHSLTLPFFEIGMKTDIFHSCGHCWVFQICWHIECSALTASSLRICSFCVFLPPLLISSASIRSIPFLSFIVPIFAWNVPLVSLIFVKISLVFPILLFSSISLHCSLRKAFLSLLTILWNSAFRWAYLSFSPLPLASLLFSVIFNSISWGWFWSPPSVQCLNLCP